MGLCNYTVLVYHFHLYFYSRMYYYGVPNYAHSEGHDIVCLAGIDQQPLSTEIDGS
jgi:hypothetical protein